MAAVKYPLSLVIGLTDRITAPFAKMSAKLAKNGIKASPVVKPLAKKLVDVAQKVKLSDVVKATKAADEAGGSFAEKVGGLVGTITGLAAAAGGGLLALVAGAEAAGSRLDDLSTQAGLNVNSYAQLEYAAKRSGVENEQFAAGMVKFNKSLSEARRGAGPLAGLLSKVGPAYLKQLKAVQTTEGGFDLLAQAMAKIEDPGKRAELAAAAFGESGARLANLLKDGPDAVEALRGEFRRLAGDQAPFVAGAAGMGDAFDNLGVAAGALRNALGGALFPAFQKLVTAITNFLAQNREALVQWAERAGAAIQKWVDDGGLQKLATSLQGLFGTVSNLVDKVGGLENAVTLVGVAMSAKAAVAAVELATAVVHLSAKMALLTLSKATWAIEWAKYLWMMRASIMAGLLPSLGAAISATWAWTVALLANPLTWIVLLIAALIVGLVALVVYWKPISAWFKKSWAQMVNYFSAKWGEFKTFMSEMWDSIVAKAKSVYEKVKPYLDLLMKAYAFTPAGFAVAGGKMLYEHTLGAASAAPMGAASAAPGANGSSTTRVQVDFNGAPRGTRVMADSQGPAEVDYSLGLALGGA